MSRCSIHEIYAAATQCNIFCISGDRPCGGAGGRVEFITSRTCIHISRRHYSFAACASAATAAQRPDSTCSASAAPSGSGQEITWSYISDCHFAVQLNHFITSFPNTFSRCFLKPQSDLSLGSPGRRARPPLAGGPCLAVGRQRNLWHREICGTEK